MTLNTKNLILKNLLLQKSFGYKYALPFKIKKDESDFDFMSKETLNLCTLCDASKLSKDKIYSFGNPDSQIIFITTTPSFESAEKEMFIKMVQNVLKMDFESIYLTSIIKCDIKENNQMAESFVSSCKGYLLNQLENYHGKIIVTLGDSYKYISGDESELNLVRGKVLKFQNKILVPLYHPNLLLRNPSLKKEAMEDLKKIKLLLEE